MNTSAKSHARFRMPISLHAYRRFVDRIHSLLGQSEDAASLVGALDGYLSGTAVEKLGLAGRPALALTFAFLRQDVDMAMERSRKARERAARRKQAFSEGTTVPVSPQSGSDAAIPARTKAEDAVNPSAAQPDNESKSSDGKVGRTAHSKSKTSVVGAGRTAHSKSKTSAGDVGSTASGEPKTSVGDVAMRQADAGATVSQAERVLRMIETMRAFGLPDSILRKITLPSILTTEGLAQQQANGVSEL